MSGESVGTIAQAYVQIMPSTEGIKGQLADIMGSESESAGKSAGGTFAGAFGKAIGGAAAVTSAVVDLGKAFVQQTNEIAAYGDNIDKMSQKMGLSAQAYQEWDAILQHSGSSIDALLPSMKTLALAAENDSAAFQRLGISQEQVASMSREDLFAATIEGLQNVTDETERTYLASQLLGRGATELGPLLNTSAEEVEAMRQRVHELGGVMSDESVKSAAAYQDALQDLQTAFAGAKRGFLAEFLPEITSVMKGITALFTGDSDQGVKEIVKGIQSLAKKIVDHAPEIAKAGVQLVIALATAIVKSIPELVMVIPDIIVAIYEGLVEGTADIREAGRELIGGVKDAFIEMIESAKQWGRDLIQSFIGGIKTRWSNFKNTIIEMAQTVKDNIGFSEPRKGPLSDFHTFAPDMVDLWNEGIRSQENAIQRQLINSFTPRSASMSASLTQESRIWASQGGGLSAGQTTNNFSITVNGIEELDEIIRWYQGRRVEGRMA